MIGISGKQPEVPYMREAEEVRLARERGVDLTKGINSLELGPAPFDVGGVMLPRPFKITGIGPVRLFAERMAETVAFYQDRLGLRLTETVTWNGLDCHFLRCGTEHHSIALYPLALRRELGLSEWSTCFSFGVRVNDYSQLRSAVDFLRDQGRDVRTLPPELFPGIDYSAFVADPDGHLVQIYYYMEQIGWDGQPCPPERRRVVDNDRWPDVLEPRADSFTGEQFMGPWG